MDSFEKACQRPVHPSLVMSAADDDADSAADGAGNDTADGA